MSVTCEALNVKVEMALKDACLIFHVLLLIFSVAFMLTVQWLIPSTLPGPARLHLSLTSHGLPKLLIFLPAS